MPFSKTFDERFGFVTADRPGGPPGALDVADSTDPKDFQGQLAADDIGFGALFPEGFSAIDNDIYDLAELTPGIYTVDVSPYDWGPSASTGGLVRTSVFSKNVAANGFGESDLGAGELTFVVNEIDNYFVRIEGRAGQKFQYSINYFEQGAILKNKPADFFPQIFETDLEANDLVIANARFEDPDGKRGAELQAK